jgi:hypothetical protein
LKVKYVSISHLLLEDLLHGKFKLPKWIDPQLPPDAKLVDIKNYPQRAYMNLYFESKEFPDVEDPEEIRIVCFRNKKDWDKAIHEKVVLN